MRNKEQMARHEKGRLKKKENAVEMTRHGLKRKEKNTREKKSQTMAITVSCFLGRLRERGFEWLQRDGKKRPEGNCQPISDGGQPANHRRERLANHRRGRLANQLRPLAIAALLLVHRCNVFVFKIIAGLLLLIQFLFYLCGFWYILFAIYDGN